ncbi:MAG TPA: oxalate/formate MFS antiporter [Anaeromyxobacteraceae bacterium]|nr:oxalate/formate MFS antiporter [Anaeromyxobacteraceae bacterium]
MSVEEAAPAHAPAGRWFQLVLGVLCMVMIANLQYGWTLFVGPIDQRFHWGRTAIQVAFTVFVVTETWLVPFEGWLVDRFGPRLVVLGGGLLVGLSWLINARAESLGMLYAAAAIGGTGAGAVYGTAVGNSLKWFTDRRGLAAGLTAAGFGAGSALTVAPIAALIKSSGYQEAFLRFGLGQGLAVVALALFLRAPRPGEAPPLPLPKAVAQSARDYTPPQALRTGLFWIMYLVFVMVASGGLMVVAELAPIAKDFGVAQTPVTLAGITLPALTFALSLDRVMNGITRPFFGWVSDHLGRERTMFIAFLLEGAGILALLHFAREPAIFVVLSGLVFFAWGEIYSLFPATCADVFGRRYCTTIYGMLYTAKGTAALLVPVAAFVSQRSGWYGVFVAAAFLNFAAAGLALFVLKPARARAQSAVLIPDAMGITRV